MKQLLLIGAGHIHRALLNQCQRFHAAGIEVSLVDPGQFWYGGAVTALLAGSITRASLRFGLARPCAAHGVSLYRDKAIGLNARHRRVWLASGRVLRYHAVSLDTGCALDPGRFEAVQHAVRVWHAASIDQLGHLHEALASETARGREPRVAVLGAGVRAASIVAGLSRAVFAGRMAITLYIPGTRLLPEAPVAAARRLARVLAGRGVEQIPLRETQPGPELLQQRDGRHYTADHLVLADRCHANRLIHASGLPGGVGGLYVNRRLYSPTEPRVFAVGACAALASDMAYSADAIPHRAELLGHNLVAGLTHRPYRCLRAGRPTYVLDLADGTGLKWRGTRWRHGRGAARVHARRDAALMAALGLYDNMPR